MKHLLTSLLLLVILTGCAAAPAPEAPSAPLQDPFAYASELSHRHGVEILVGEKAAEVLPWDYDITPETDSQKILEA